MAIVIQYVHVLEDALPTSIRTNTIGRSTQYHVPGSEGQCGPSRDVCAAPAVQLSKAVKLQQYINTVQETCNMVCDTNMFATVPPTPNVTLSRTRTLPISHAPHRLRVGRTLQT